ncbi:type 1 glutamine amidotransferase [Ectothiorhodospiraceae bacterium WFHF3C12]|nr:type 1 glutamine amidotransferase [Ectothiorhodospiraceae bacterium WFHF3C12]
MIDSIHVLQHVPFEGPAALGRWADSRGVGLKGCRLFDDASPPDPAGVGGLIVLGGPMGVHDQEAYPWLRQEKAFIRGVLERRAPVLGICLGAQLIADVMGAPVTRLTHPEIGWHPVHFSPPARSHRLFRDFPETLEVMHWHGDTFECPAGMTAVGHSEACANQGFFDPGGRVLALQCHLEWDAEQATRLADAAADELASDSPYVQSRADILRADAPFAQGNEWMFRLMDRFFGQ